MTEPIQSAGDCLVCQRRDPHRGTVCGPCRQLLRDQLDELTALWPLIPDELLTRNGQPSILALDLMTPVPSALSRRTAGGVSDTMIPRQRTTIDVITDPADGRELGRIWHREPVYRADGQPELVPVGDQTGPVPLVRWADTWVQAWRDQRTSLGYREQLPAPTIDRLAGWLRTRIDWAADSHGTALDDLADELREQVALLRRVTHMAPRFLPIACPGCDRRLTLTRWPNSKYDECRWCRALVTRSEYDDHLDQELIGGAA